MWGAWLGLDKNHDTVVWDWWTQYSENFEFIQRVLQ